MNLQKERMKAVVDLPAKRRVWGDPDNVERSPPFREPSALQRGQSAVSRAENRGGFCRWLRIERDRDNFGQPPGCFIRKHPDYGDELGGIPSSCKLATELLRISVGEFIVVHRLGSMKLSLPAVRNELSLAKAEPVSVEAMAKLGLMCMSPVMNPCWSLPAYITPQVLEKPFVVASACPAGYFYLFDPQMLLRAPKVRILRSSASHCVGENRNDESAVIREGLVRVESRR